MKLSSITILGALLLLVSVSLANAQAPPGWGWVNHFGVYDYQGGNGVAGLGRDAAGNLYMAGNYFGTPDMGGTVVTNRGATDVFLAKYSPAGALLWVRTLQSTGSDGAAALVVEPNGRCTLTGTFGGGTGDNLAFGSTSATVLAGPALLNLPSSSSGYEPLCFVAAIDATGALLWAHNPSPTYGTYVSSLRRDGAGNSYLSVRASVRSSLIVNGHHYPPIGDYDAILLKYTAAGQPAAVRRVGVPGGFGYNGEVYTDNADAVYWLVGHAGPLTIDQVTTVGVAPGTGTLSLVKISAANQVRWIKPGLLRIGTDNALSEILELDAATNMLYLSGGSSGGAVSYTGSSSPVPMVANADAAWVAQCDTAGVIQWVKLVAYAANVPGNS